MKSEKVMELLKRQCWWSAWLAVALWGWLVVIVQAHGISERDGMIERLRLHALGANAEELMTTRDTNALAGVIYLPKGRTNLIHLILRGAKDEKQWHTGYWTEVGREELVYRNPGGIIWEGK